MLQSLCYLFATVQYTIVQAGVFIRVLWKQSKLVGNPVLYPLYTRKYPVQHPL
jgi:hypothetical protein